MAKVKPIPDGYHAVTPHLILDDCSKAIEFYKKAFGAEERSRMAGMGGSKIVHAEIRIGDSVVMMADEMPMPGMPGVYKSPKTAGLSTASLMLYVKDADASFDRAVKAGATVRQPLQDMFWGDRYGTVIDPFGVSWSIATHKEDVSPQEMAKRAKAFEEEMAKKIGGKK